VYPVVLGRGKRRFDSAVFSNGRLKLDFATAGERDPKSGVGVFGGG
jgi:hypothetical protein